MSLRNTWTRCTLLNIKSKTRQKTKLQPPSVGRDGELHHTSTYDKPDDFNFHIINFPFLSRKAIFQLRPPIASLYRSLYDMTGLGCFQLLNYFVWLGITDEGSVPEMRIWSTLLIKSNLKCCIHLSRSLLSYFNYLMSVTADGPRSPRGHI